MFGGGPADHTEQPRPERGLAVNTARPSSTFRVRILEHVTGLAPIESAAAHRPADAFGVVRGPFPAVICLPVAQLKSN